MNNLIFQDIRYKNTLFCVTPMMTTGDEGFFSLRDFKILEVDTTTRRVKKQFWHGEEIWGTYNNAREIVIVFDAFASDQIARFALIKKVNQLFSPTIDTWDKLEFAGPDGSQWWCEVKTIARPAYSDYDNEKWITVTVKLISRNNSNIYSSDKQIVSTTNHPFGVIVPFSSPFIYGIGWSIITYTGPSSSPLDIDIIATQDNPLPFGYLMIKNATDNENSLITLYLDTFEIGDTIRINSTINQVFLQKSWYDTRNNITALTDPNSTYPLLINGDNNVGIYNGGDEVMMTAYISYYEIRS